VQTNERSIYNRIYFYHILVVEKNIKTKTLLLLSKLNISLILLIGFGIYNGKSQNLIANGSFENYTGIDCVYGGFDNYNATPIYHVLDDWYTLNSSDYFSSVCTNTYAGVPVNLFGESLAKNGSSYVGFILFQANTEMKEYVYQHLITPLQAGKMYCLSFYVSRADGITHAIHSIGAYFSNNVQSTGSLGYVNKTPQIENQNSFVTDTIGWTQIQGCYTAIGGEQYITIGNFNSNANTDTLYVGSNIPTANAYKYAYYFIDDITLIDQSTVGNNELENENNFDIYPNPNNGIFTINSKDIIQKIEVTNIAGQLLVQESTNSKTHQLHLNHIAQGIYFIKVNYANGLSVNKKVIVNP
jgi:hypothetical protein